MEKTIHNFDGPQPWPAGKRGERLALRRQQELTTLSLPFPMPLPETAGFPHQQYP